MDNIFIAHEILHFLGKKKQGKKGYVSINFDISKVYDRVKWNYLRSLVIMGMQTKLVDLIMGCVSLATFSIPRVTLYQVEE